MSELLSAATATLVGSVGDWVNGARFTGIATSTDMTPLVGATHGEATTQAGANSTLTTPSGASGFPVIPGVEYAMYVGVSGDTASRLSYIQFKWYTGAGALIATDSGAAVALVIGSWRQAVFVKTAPATSAFGTLRLIYDEDTGSVGDGEKFYWDRCSVRPSSDASHLTLVGAG